VCFNGEGINILDDEEGKEKQQHFSSIIMI
jgi:hypothetical protein